jgi:drug/metabolite transporter (DMT)-like permease
VPVIPVVLLAAVLHASWNALLKPIDERLATFALGGLATAAVCLPAAPFEVPNRAAWSYVAASGALHVVYNMLLARSFAAGEFNQVYPLARGSSPLLVALGAAVLAHEHLGGARLAGLLVVSAGLSALAGRPRRGDGPAVGLALCTGVLIAAYTLVDGIGVRHAGDPLSYIVWLFALQSILTAVVARRQLPGVVHRWRRGLTVAVLSTAAYGLVIWAQRHGALAAIAALRETSVIIAAGIGAIVFHERLGTRRTMASVTVVAGVVLLNS